MAVAAQGDRPGPTDASSASADRIADLAEHLATHEPSDAAEAGHVARLLTTLRADGDPFAQEAGPVHVTGSGIVLPTDGSARTVLLLHKRLDRWLQPGGHVDAGERAQDGAIREVVEETGLAVRHPQGGATLVHVHVHDGGRGHTHLDTRWLLLADPTQPFAPGDGESDQVGWFDLDGLEERSDRTVVTAFLAACRAHGIDPPGA